MKFDQKHAGKWVAAKDDKVIATGKTLTKLMQKVKTTKDHDQIKYALIPKGYIAG